MPYGIDLNTMLNQIIYLSLCSQSLNAAQSLWLCYSNVPPHNYDCQVCRPLCCPERGLFVLNWVRCWNQPKQLSMGMVPPKNILNVQKCMAFLVEMQAIF